MDELKVLIVDDHKLFAEAIRTILQHEGMEVQVAASADEALQAAHRRPPDLALMDLNMPGTGGMEAGRRLLAEHPATKVLALTAVEDPRAVSEATRAGFHGYLMKDASMTQFVSSIRAALDGQVVVPHRLAAPAAGARSQEERRAAFLSQQLTPREREVLTLLVQGFTSGDIARDLSVSPNTVRTHIQSILTKLQVHSRLEAAAFAVRFGVVKVPGKREVP